MKSLIIRILFRFHYGKQSFLPFTAAIVMILFVHHSMAQIIYTDINPDQTFNTNNATVNLDINKDGINDFSIVFKSTVSGSNGCTGTHYDRSVKITALNSNAVANTNQNPSMLTSCDQVNSSCVFTTGANQVLFNDRWLCQNNMWKENKTGNWITNALDKYVGLKIIVGANTYYGWAKLTASADFTSFTLKEYGCSNTANQSIGAGGQDILWQKSYGGNKNETACSIDKTTDGGYVIAGNTATNNNGDVGPSKGKTDFWVIKINADGGLVWQKVFGGNSDEGAQAVKQTQDGGYLLAGTVSSTNGDVSGNHGMQDFWVLKLDANGNLQWQKCYGGSSNEIAYVLALTSDHGCVVAGTTYSSDGDVTGNHSTGDYWIIKIDSVGNLQWQKAYGGSAFDFAHAIAASDDGGYIVSGYGRSNDGDVSCTVYGQEDLWILKLNHSGNIVWQKSYGGTGGEGASAIEQTSDGGYIVNGITHSSNVDVTDSHGEHEAWVVKIDSAGNLQWKECLGGIDTENGNDIYQTTDGGFILAVSADSQDGNLTVNHGGHDFWIVKITSTGSIEWQKSLGGTLDEEPYSVIQCNDGNFMIVGYSNSSNMDVSGNHGLSDFWVVKVAAQTQKTFYADLDGDGYGNLNSQTVACTAPMGYVSNFSDCNDSNSNIHPNQSDLCNGVDDDCDGYSDENGLTASISPLATITICSTSSLQLRCMSTSPGYSYQWYKNNSVIAGATNSTCYVSTEDFFHVVITSGACIANSPETSVRTIEPVAAITPTGTTTVCPGRSVNFKVSDDWWMTYQWYNSQGAIAGATNAKYTATAPGAYYVIKSDIAGCNLRSDSSMLVNTIVSTSIAVVGDLNLCTSSTVTLQAQIVSGYTYQWYKDNVSISGATSPTYVAGQQGNYKYLATTSGGCTAFSETKTATSCGLRTASPDKNQRSISAYPNPMNDIGTIRLILPDAEMVALRIFDLSGRLVKTISNENLDEGEHLFEWDAHDESGNEVANGIYLLQLSTPESSYAIRLSVVK